MKIGSTDINDVKVGSTQINKIYKDGVVYWGSLPSLSDALFWLDGEILDVSGTKYFKDQTTNGRNFLITNYDFDSTWKRGFPYKSTATISAPSGDSDLIAADVNNFLYTSGTPNQIPVISLFQNIDYKNRLFARHVASVIDDDNIETYEPRVLDIVLYGNTKTGSDLTSCNTYYEVPAIDASAKWIDPVNGNDTTGNGTQSLPYKTHSKVNGLTLTEGTLVYCLTGTISPIAWGKNYNLTQIGYLKINDTTTARGIDYDPAGTLSQTLQGYYIENNSTAGGPTGINCNAINHSLTLNKFKFANNTTGPAVNSLTYSTQTLNVNNSIFSNVLYGVYANKTLNVNDCLIRPITYGIYKDNASKSTISVNYSKIIAPGSIWRIYGLADVNTNNSYFEWAGTSLGVINTTTVGDWSFQNTTFKYTGSTTTGLMSF